MGKKQCFEEKNKACQSVRTFFVDKKYGHILLKNGFNMFTYVFLAIIKEKTQ